MDPNCQEGREQVWAASNIPDHPGALEESTEYKVTGFRSLNLPNDDVHHIRESIREDQRGVDRQRGLQRLCCSGELPRSQHLNVLECLELRHDLHGVE